MKVKSYNKSTIIISLENLGWLRKNPLQGGYINWIGNIYKDRIYERKWRGYFFWQPYTEEQLDSLSKLIKKLTNDFNIPETFIGHNVKVEKIEKFQGIATYSNYETDRTDLNPSFNFEEFIKKNKKMNNQYDELKNLLNVSRNMLGKNDLTESRKVLKRNGIINEQEVDDDGPTNIDIDSEQEIEIETTPDEDKQKSYRVSGGLITLHGNTKQELELSTDEKTSYQETMDEFVNEVSDLSDFGTLNVYPNNVDWSGKVIDYDVEFYFSIGETNGVYINGDMIKLDDGLVELINKLTSYYDKFKAKWAKVLSQRKKTKNVDEE
jgi:hypothetical protein